jgi:parallel beta-helix repeat protein
VEGASRSEPETIIVDINGTGDYTSIQDAIDNANEGDTIEVWDGTYYENIYVNKSVSLLGNGSVETVLEGNNRWPVIIVVANWVNISGFLVSASDLNSSSHDYYGIYLYNVSNCTLQNNNFSKIGFGIQIGNSNGNEIINNTGNFGISIYNSNNNFVINNIITSYYYYFSIYDTLSSFNTFSNNIVINGYVYFIDSTSLCFKNNTLISCDFFLEGRKSSHWDSHIILNNTINGKSLIYWVNYHDLLLPPDAELIILVNCSKINIENKIFKNSSIGILLYSSNNITIKNNLFLERNFILQFSNRLVIINSDFNSIINNTISNERYGILLQDGSDSNLIKNNNINSVWTGIYLTDSNSNVIENNNCSEAEYGIYLKNSNENEITNNSCSSSENSISLESSDFNLISENICESNRENGIVLSNSQSNTIINNSCSDNNLYGIFIHENSNFNKITSNSCLNNSNGLSLITNSSIISNNLCNYNKWYGISLSGFGNNLNNNSVSNNKYGINLEGSNNIAEYNNVSNNNIGISLGGSKNIIRNNNISNNSNGLSFDHSANNNTVFNNTISYNTEDGLLTSVLTINNNIYHNKIISNFEQIYIWFNPYKPPDEINNNFWNNSNQEGNYWSDYTGVDNGANGRLKGDGIGDTKLPHQGVDNYPFMNQNCTVTNGTIADSGSGNGDDGGFWNNMPMRRTCSILLVIGMLILFLILKIFFRKKKKK